MTQNTPEFGRSEKRGLYMKRRSCIVLLNTRLGAQGQRGGGGGAWGN